MKKTLCLVLVLMTVALVALPVFSSLAEGTRMYVKTGNGKNLNVRAEPVMADNIIGTIKYGTAVDVLQTKGKWSLIELASGSDPAWVVSSYLVYTKPEPFKKKDIADKTVDEKYSAFKLLGDEAYPVIVNPSKAGGFISLRWAPAKSAPVMKKLPADTELTVLAEGKNWLQVQEVATGYVGFVDKKLVK